MYVVQGLLRIEFYDLFVEALCVYSRSIGVNLCHILICIPSATVFLDDIVESVVAIALHLITEGETITIAFHQSEVVTDNLWCIPRATADCIV